MSGRRPNDLDLTAQYWWSVADLCARWGIKAQMVWILLKPYRGRCHRARRGKHPRLTLWVPIDVVRELDRERQNRLLPAAGRKGCQAPPSPITDGAN
jgi:hypothetical protein